jgi:predicted DNA-binding protein (MmcQ/YjbR family)
MPQDWVRKLCMSLPRTTEEVLWGDNLVFKVGGKMYALMPLEPARLWLSFKVSEAEFAELCEREGVVPAPYSARHHWVALEANAGIPVAELKQLLRQAYTLVRARLPKKVQAQFE